MLIECIIKRDGNTEVTRFGTKYLFVKNAEGIAVADIQNADHARQLLKMPRHYRRYDPTGELAAAEALEQEQLDNEDQEIEDALEQSFDDELNEVVPIVEGPEEETDTPDAGPEVTDADRETITDVITDAGETDGPVDTNTEGPDLGPEGTDEEAGQIDAGEEAGEGPATGPATEPENTQAPVEKGIDYTLPENKDARDKKVLELREKGLDGQKVTQQDIADHMGITRSVVGKIVAAHNKPQA